MKGGITMAEWQMLCAEALNGFAIMLALSGAGAWVVSRFLEKAGIKLFDE